MGGVVPMIALLAAGVAGALLAGTLAEQASWLLVPLVAPFGASAAALLVAILRNVASQDGGAIYHFHTTASWLRAR